MSLYGKIIDEPQYGIIEETNETYFYITVEGYRETEKSKENS